MGTVQFGSKEKLGASLDCWSLGSSGSGGAGWRGLSCPASLHSQEKGLSTNGAQQWVIQHWFFLMTSCIKRSTRGKGGAFRKKIHRKISVCCSLVREGFPRESANQARPGSVDIMSASQEEHWRGLCNIESAATDPVYKMGRKHSYSPRSNEVQISRCLCPSGWFTAFISSWFTELQT